MSYAEALSALADPTRRRIYEHVRRRPHAVVELTRHAEVSQPAVSQHLRVLLDAQLVTRQREGRRSVYSATPDGLAELKTWIEATWDDVLAAYAGGVPPSRRKDE